MEVSGLPLHVLAVHAAVVFGPLAALMSLAYGVAFFDSGRVDGFSGEILAKIEKHQDYANDLR